MENLQQENQEELSVNELTDKVLQEREVLGSLGVKKHTLAKLRNAGEIWFCPITKTDRVYFAGDILEYLKTKRTKLNQS